jgi:hypothetical protein
MALAVDKNGKVYEKRLNMSEDEIRKIIENSDKEHHRKVLQRALSVKINREIVS